jgi:ornithine carbamoyltransferase
VPRSFLSQNDLTPSEVREVFELTRTLKTSKTVPALQGQSLVMFFEKSSTRTRLSFEIGMTQLGGHAVYLDRESSQLSRGESISDTARVVSRYADIMMARVNAHATVVELARTATVPVINGLSDEEHPCQSMADLFTMVEHKGSIEGLTVTYVGDGNNNVTHSLMLGVTQLGGNIRVAAPPTLQPDARYVEMAQQNAVKSGGSLLVTTDAVEAVEGADVIYTDVWVSMGRESGREERIATLEPYRVDQSLAAHAAPDYIFMHCLPAHIGEEVTGNVAYGPNSVIFDEAENRLHVQKALMVYLLGVTERVNA